MDKANGENKLKFSNGFHFCQDDRKNWEFCDMFQQVLFGAVETI